MSTPGHSASRSKLGEKPAMDASEIIARLGLALHPEGGHYRETWRGADAAGRPSGTAIYYLLAAGEMSAWHRLDAGEAWHFYLGDPLELQISLDGDRVERLVLGPDLRGGERLQALVPAHAWQSARTLGAWTLTGCTMAPGFTFEGFELAPSDWSPERATS